MAQHPLLETATGKVVNVIELDDGSNWAPAAGYNLGAPGGLIGQIWNGSSYETPLVLPPIEAYSAAVQSLIDQTAQKRNYADGVSLASYDNDPNPVWAAEATAFKAWRSAVWVYVYTQLALVQSGARTPQPSVAQILSELPAISWPA